MRAIVITEPGGPEVLQPASVPDPIPGPHEVLVEVRAAGINHSDLSQRAGSYPAPPHESQDILGLEIAGTVLTPGSDVQGWSAGDRVFALIGSGGYAERVKVHEDMLIPIPDNFSFEEAAAVPEVYYTAYDALFNQAGLIASQSVLIHAVGSGVGTAALQLAHDLGATTYGTAGSNEKLARARELGLDVGTNYNSEDFAEVIKARTEGRGVNVILDLVGASYWERNLQSLAVLGHMVLIGTVGGNEIATRTSALMGKRLRIFGTVLRPRPLEEKILLTKQFKAQILPRLADGRLKPIVDKVYPLNQASEAHAYLNTHANFGKVILTV
ncbi:MAG TPA: NAD(P)H-quinone oxidoreductase [Dehalococcoidia bacterium]|nr:NAD(P)H-quinone oxidoreductase [Dehalococcoidia bacterium]